MAASRTYTVTGDYSRYRDAMPCIMKELSKLATIHLQFTVYLMAPKGADCLFDHCDGCGRLPELMRGAVMAGLAEVDSSKASATVPLIGSMV